MMNENTVNMVNMGLNMGLIWASSLIHKYLFF